MTDRAAELVSWDRRAVIKADSQTLKDEAAKAWARRDEPKPEDPGPSER